MGRPRSRQARRRIALALCVTWIVGFELLPWMHVALHDHLAPHHHDASGAVVLGEASHDHDDRDAEVDEHGAAVADHHDHDRDAEIDEHGAPVADRHDDDLDAKVVEQRAVAEPGRTPSRGLGAPSFEQRSNVVVARADDRSSEHGLTRLRTRVSRRALDDSQARLRRALSHGAHSLAHHGIAVPVPAPAITDPLPVDRRPFAVADVVACMAIGRVAATPSARGPPGRLI